MFPTAAPGLRRHGGTGKVPPAELVFEDIANPGIQEAALAWLALKESHMFFFCFFFIIWNLFTPFRRATHLVCPDIRCPRIRAQPTNPSGARAPTKVGAAVGDAETTHS